MIDTLQKRQAALSVRGRRVLPLPDGTIDVIDRGMMLGVYWIEDTSSPVAYPLRIRFTRGDMMSISVSRGSMMSITITRDE